ncbi:unnamed protein product [Kuraishia capsulata CBS 1993]|uniref:ATPase expression protein 2, mitochondrial n=1 Tax=Kuraishia capsulata CBS 1993 TaxID=1382522 RepID=W6MLZ7_9ASCO|nr:uncharacterized protein KUCA_T00001893001 [Kuraishia capsulata CBS 1993]CDK25922.1 unnamed protein product [Kuraishia capsulata CBS 1993]
MGYHCRKYLVLVTSSIVPVLVDKTSKMKAGPGKLIKHCKYSRGVSTVADAKISAVPPIIPKSIQHVRQTFFSEVMRVPDAHSLVSRPFELSKIISPETLQKYRTSITIAGTVKWDGNSLKQRLRKGEVSECLRKLVEEPDLLANMIETFQEREFAWFIHECCKYLNRLSILQRGREFLNDAGDSARQAEDILHSTKLGDMKRFNLVLTAIKESKRYELQVSDYEQILWMQTYSGEMTDALFTLNEFESTARKLINKERTIPLYFTTLIWNCKFQILADGLPELWKVDGKKIMRNKAKELHPHFEYLHHDRSIHLLIRMFQNERLSPDADTLRIMLLCLGKSGNLEILRSFISKMWGINQDGSVSRRHLRKPGSLFHPNMPLLSAIISAFAIQNEFLEGMSYVDSFVSTYNMDMSKSEQFWATCFRFLELVERGKLKYHGSEQRKDLSLLPLKERMVYKAKTYTFPDSLWKLSNSQCAPTARLYTWRVRYLFLTYRISELRGVLVPLYEMAKSHQVHNSRKKVAHETSELLYVCITASIRLLISRGYENQAARMVEDFSLNREMKERLDRVFEYRKARQVEHMRRLKSKQAKRMEEEDDDGLLSWL